MEDNKLAQKNLEGQLEIYKKISDAQERILWLFRHEIVKVISTPINDKIKCVDSTIPVENRKWTVEISDKNRWQLDDLCRVADSSNRYKYLDNDHLKLSNEIELCKGILNKLQ